ncbi:hypothetical protein [Parasitella parasitica]|uniref:Uncharacterized protein n=1 Tax=Parasitella parasitica TaxID=35722 RepID=A0A0B7NS26_9FUNG|nr:hypothetical protein [Parasitella parasitica]
MHHNKSRSPSPCPNKSYNIIPLPSTFSCLVPVRDSYSISTEFQLPRIMMACEERGINVIPCVSPYLISTNKLNTTPLLTDKYTEITEIQLELLNEDWNFDLHLRAVSAQLLAGCLLVKKNELLLVNCIELYSRSKHQDIQSERFVGSVSPNSSAPIGDEMYEIIKISNIDDLCSITQLL